MKKPIFIWLSDWIVLPPLESVMCPTIIPFIKGKNEYSIQLPNNNYNNKITTYIQLVTLPQIRMDSCPYHAPYKLHHN